MENAGASPLAAVIHRNITARIFAQIDLSWPRDFLLAIEQHFLPLRNPPRCSRNREEHWKHGDRQTHRLIDKARVKIHVRIELSLDEVLILERDSLALEDVAHYNRRKGKPFLQGEAEAARLGGIAVLVRCEADRPGFPMNGDPFSIE